MKEKEKEKDAKCSIKCQQSAVNNESILKRDLMLFTFGLGRFNLFHRSQS